jgi:alkanesulfonate monooxygenase SsuD/methylene tetrahydromethanopterin reductase-like flavin-dependent oxidoreductase (luciferase family)
VTDGRFTLGLGTGVRKLNETWHGVTNFGGPVQHMREVVEFVRRFVAEAHIGEPIRYQGEFLDIDLKGYKRPMRPARTRIPVCLAANKPRMLQLSGEIADGVLGHLFLSPRHVRDNMLPAIERGLKIAGRQRSDISVGAGITCAIDPDRATARRHAAGPVAFYATVRTYASIFAGDGFAGEAAAIREAFMGGDRQGAVDLVTDDMIDTYCAAGTPDEVLEAISRFDGLLDVKGITPPRHFCPPDAHVAYRDRLLELFAQ